MKIGVDIRVLMDEYYSGVAEYTANLLKAILAQDKNNNYKLFYNSFHNENKKLAIWQGVNAQVKGTHIPNKIFNYLLQSFFSYPKLDKVLGGVDIFWSPHFNFTRLSSNPKLKKIITVHDLSFLRYPEFFSVRKNFWHGSLAIKRTLLAAEAIVAVSENTKRDIIELIGVKPEKIRLIYSGNNLNKREVGASEKQEFLDKYKLSGTLILYLGNIEPRKNIKALILAFNILKDKEKARKLKNDTKNFKNDSQVFKDNTQNPKESQNKPKTLKLVLAGANAWKNKKIYRAWRKSPYRDDIIFLGYISKKEREVLYSLASVFAYPSFYEGFGFPPLEAMTYGLPVVCSNNSSLPEVVGKGALMINPFKVEELAEALDMVLNDETVRQTLIKQGYERVKIFSWEKTAQEYLQLFTEIYEE